MNQLNKWQQELENLSRRSEVETNKKLHKYYQEALRGIKKEVKQYIEQYDELSFSKKLEAERLMEVGKQMDAILDGAYSKVNQEVAGHSRSQAEQGYYGTWYAIEGAENIQLDMSMLPERYIQQLVNHPVKGKTFSKRLYDHRDKLAKNVTSALNYAAVHGQGYAVAAKRIGELTEASYKQAFRIARTEGGRVQSTAKQRSYKEAKKKGVDLKKKWFSTLDGVTRDTHRSLDGVTVEVDEEFESSSGAKAEGPRLFGVAEEDIHCRCTTVAEVEGISSELRKDNETGEIVEYKNYKEWLKSKENSSIKEKITNIDMSSATKDDIIDIGKAINDQFDIRSQIGDKDSIKKILSQFRDFGGKINDSTWAKGSRKIAKNKLNEAFSYYPKEWASLLEDNGKHLFAGINQRGFFSKRWVDSNGLLKPMTYKESVNTLTIYLSDPSNTVAYHEIGHLVEHFSPDTLRISKEFIAARTANEQALKLADIFPGYGYDQNEVTKADDFISPYIGKEYSEASEVLSMGLESIFEPGYGQVKKIENGKQIIEKITDDEEYLNLIIGLLVKG